jgi:hypothetical protein
MTLDPERYVCPVHHIDLTSRVEEELEFEGSPVAYRSGPRRPFQVIVTCEGSGTPHTLTCTGTHSP